MKNLNYRELVESKQKKIKELIAKGITSPSKIIEVLFPSHDRSVPSVLANNPDSYKNEESCLRKDSLL